MKNILNKFFLIFILIIVGVVSTLIYKFINTSKDVNNNISQNINTENIQKETSEQNQYIDTNPIKIGIYDDNSTKTKRVLISEYTGNWSYHKDINVFNIFFTNDAEIDGSRIAVCFDKYAKLYSEDISNYQIGFNVKFETQTETIEKTILTPNDTTSFFDYLEIYLYDGYHRSANEWYSHTTEEEFNDKTIFTGIKLTAGKNINQITSDIELTAFSYDNDDFDENENYRGISKYSIVVKKK